MQTDTYAALKKLLADERASLRNGDFDALESYAAQKESLLMRDVKAAFSQRQLRHVARQLQENQTLLKAAIGGVQAARERLAALQAVRKGLGVYDQHGQRAPSCSAAPGLNRKA